MITGSAIQEIIRDLRARQDAGEQMVCPRCGRNTLKTPLAHNALSRYAHVYVCDECGMTEAMLAMMNNPLPLEQWAAMSDRDPENDYRTLPMEEVAGRVLGSQVDDLLRLHREWVLRGPDARFSDLKQQALESCPGMVDLLEEPFCAVYPAADGKVHVRLRWRGDKSDIAVDTVPDKK